MWLHFTRSLGGVADLPKSLRQASEARNAPIRRSDVGSSACLGLPGWTNLSSDTVPESRSTTCRLAAHPSNAGLGAPRRPAVRLFDQEEVTVLSLTTARPVNEADVDDHLKKRYTQYGVERLRSLPSDQPPETAAVRQPFTIQQL
jgi:hypothetical protein